MKNWSLNEYYSKIFSYILLEGEYVYSENFIKDWVSRGNEYTDPWDVYDVVLKALQTLQEKEEKNN